MEQPFNRDNGNPSGEGKGGHWKGKRDLIRDEVVRRYSEGASIAGLSRDLDVGEYVVTTCLQESGVTIRSTAQDRRAAIAEQVRRMYIDEMVSMPAIARSLGVGRDVIRGCLADLGIEPRSLHEAALARMQDPNARGRVGRHAHLAMGYGNAELAELLRLLGVEADRERVVGPLNVDMVVGHLAVEVAATQGNPLLAGSRERGRAEYLFRRGFAICFVWSGPCRLPRLGAAKHIIAWSQGTDGAPPEPGEYRMIRGCGELLAAGSDHLDEFTLPASRKSHRRCYET